MRAAHAGVALALLAAPALAASKLTPAEIQATFFNGQQFTAATTSGVTFKMVFTPDGKVTREPGGKVGAKGEGTWKLSKDGFCTAWKGAKASCFTLVNVDKNRWSVVRGATTIAVWSK